MYWTEFVTVAVVHLFAVASPGPDFAVVLKNSVSSGRRIAMYTAFGVATGILIHVTYSLLGIALVISQSIWLFNLISWLGAGYLLWIGVQALRSKPQVGEFSEDLSAGSKTLKSAYIQGFITNGLNPKATLFFLSLFTVIISPQTPWQVQLGYGLYMAVATGIWFSFVAWLFSTAKVRQQFHKIGHWFDRGMGVVLIGLGLRLILSQ